MSHQSVAINKNSGYDRGHLFPARDVKYNRKGSLACVVPIATKNFSWHSPVASVTEHNSATLRARTIRHDCDITRELKQHVIISPYSIFSNIAKLLYFQLIMFCLQKYTCLTQVSRTIPQCAAWWI